MKRIRSALLVLATLLLMAPLALGVKGPAAQRQTPKRAAKSPAGASYKAPARGGKTPGGRARQAEREVTSRIRIEKRSTAVARAAVRAAHPGGPRTKAEFLAYPPGSYAHFRGMYLDGKLRALGARPDGLLDFRHASVEADHSPNDGAQRPGPQRGRATFDRVAVPLPRDMHQSHPTTVGGRYYDPAYSVAQRALVLGGRYDEALQTHLLSTLSDRVIGSNGPAKVQQVLGHMNTAVTYAGSTNIRSSLFRGHAAGTPALRDEATLRTSLRNRVEELRRDDKVSPGFVNPF
jgi:hypothetical protein